MGWTTRTLVLLLVLAAALAGPVRAQDALVLGGGGSRGLAHVGALTGLEQRGYQASIVAGTSIGAIIGGLYAAGFSVDSIQALVRAEDWQELFAPPRWAFGPDWTPRRPMLRLGLGVDRRRYPDGLIPDLRVNRALVRLLFDPAARARGDFDRLPRRYRSIATDLRTGEAVVLGRGDLARAVRASMAVPGVFAPVAWDSTWLVDGGIADYLPVGPAKRMGARRVVAIDVVQPPRDSVHLFPLQVLIRGFRLTLENARRSDVEPDILVAPNIDPDLAGAVFLRDPSGLFDAGLEAAQLQAPRFGPPQPPPTPAPPPARITRVGIETGDPGLEPLVRRALRNVPGAYDPDRVLGAIERLYATGFFNGVWPRVEADPADDDAIHLTVRADALAPRALAAAFGFDNDREFRGWAALQQRFAGPNEATLAVSAGSLDRFISLALRRPLERILPLALSAGVAWSEHDIRGFDADGHITGEREITRAGGWLGLTSEPLGGGPSLRLALVAEHIDDDNGVTGWAAGPALRLATAEPASRIVGTPSYLEMEWRAGDLEYRRASLAGALSWQRGLWLAAALARLDATSAGAPVNDWPALGDGAEFPGLRWGEARSRSLALAGVDVARTGPAEAYLLLKLRGAAVAPSISDLDDTRWLAGAELGAGWWTPLGRLYFGVGANTEGDWQFRLDVGRQF